MNHTLLKKSFFPVLDATSKLPAGVLQGTFADYGSFDECLKVETPHFKGQSCALEARPPRPPLSRDFTLVKAHLDGNNGTLSGFFKVAHEALHHKKLRLVVCVPSSCSLQDMRAIAKRGRVLEAFSLASNGRRLFSAPGGSSTEFACIHGIRALSMFWVVLGHTYVLMDFELLKDPSGIQSFFRSLEFELVHNGWLAVETFFLLSGVLMSVGGLKFLQKSKGCFNIPLMALRRYLRLAPSLLLLMGLVFFLPLLSSGPFWYQHVDPQVKSCAEYWWASLLFLSNWFGINKGCTLVTWYLAVDLQLYVLSLFFLLILYRYCKVGVALLVLSIGVSCAAIALQTLVHDVMPSPMLSAVDNA
ncbi:nose resistant to fluoxetine protein 6 [Trichonephila inaurata madagascariensis]|uniref:Nose resistant to fluoxetine protein 6 n=1 Tax=Trichonephila inaurata madagascariensis TaxID=2747483 RepID=A0A8X6XCC0_9ARAC|nr:nose resistant to fluoxetine protein 6 [Trichonephila inaurata madagascariensis]